MLRSLIIMLTGCVFFLLPWYYMDPGQPQPVDVPILLLLLTFIFLNLPYLTQLIRSVRIYQVFLLFSGYAIVTLLTNFIVETNDIALRILTQNSYSIILITTFFLVFMYLDKLRDNQLYHLILTFLLLDLIIPFGYWMLTRSIGTRVSLSFANANQLGFFALVNLAIIFYVILQAKEKGIPLNKFKVLIILNTNLLFLFVCTSRACYPAILLYVISYFVFFRIKLRGYTLWLFGVIGLSIAIFFMIFVGQKLLGHMQHVRMDVNLQTSSSIMREFYFRAFQGADSLFNNGWAFMFGSGNYTTSGRRALEFHNNFVAIFFQVGLIGLLFYLYMNILIIKELLKKGFYYLVPYFCYLYYSMFHYSYRTRINWLLLALIIFIIINDKRKAATQVHPNYSGNS